MLTDYSNQYYDPQSKRFEALLADDYAKAKEIAEWKRRLRREWQNVSLVSIVKPDSSNEDVTLGKEFKSEIVLSIGDLRPEEIGVELLFATTDSKGKLHISSIAEYAPVEVNDGVAKYEAMITPEVAGLYQVAARIYAKNDLLPHRQDFELVRWL